ncbi:MAG: prepilin-type cleavage/methylation domain-containing protein [Gallionella sp.]
MNKHTKSLPKFATQHKSAQEGVVLLEALVAILLFSMGVLALVGLQAAMIKNTTDSKLRSEASFIAQQRIGQIWADPDPTRPGYISFVEANTDISTALPNGTRTVTQPAPGQFQVTVSWQQPGESAHNFTTFATITGG